MGCKLTVGAGFRPEGLRGPVLRLTQGTLASSANGGRASRVLGNARNRNQQGRGLSERRAWWEPVMTESVNGVIALLCARCLLWPRS